MERFSGHQYLDSALPDSFQSRDVNNVSNTSRSSGILNVTSPFLSHGEALNAHIKFGTSTMVSTPLTPTPSIQTCSFYLLRDDARKSNTTSVLGSFSMCEWFLLNSRPWIFACCRNTVGNECQPVGETWRWTNLSKKQESQGELKLIFALFAR